MRALLFGLVLCLSVLPAAAQSVADVGDHLVTLAPPAADAAGKAGVLVRASEVVLVPFTGVAFEGVAERPEGLAGAVRFETGAGWSDWHPLYVVPSATDGFFLAAYRSDEVRADVRFEVRLRAPLGGSVTIGGAAVFDNRLDADRLETERGAADKLVFPFPGRDDGIVLPPRLVARRAWNAAPFRGTPVPLARPRYTTLTFHHAAGFGADNLADGKAQVKRIQDFHQNGRGWSDIGYQFVMDEVGNVYQGRPFLSDDETLEAVPILAMGAHVGGANTGNIGVSLLGCYHPPEGANCRDTLTPAAFDSVATLFAFLAERYDVPPERIFGHRDFSATACPGNNNYALLDELRARVARLLVEGNGPIGQAVLAAEVTTTGEVEIDWSFVEDNGIVGYRLERIYRGDTLDVAVGEGTLPEQFVDAELPWAGTAVYRLYARNGAGREALLATATVDVEVPEAYVLTESFPNPFTTSATIRYALEREGHVLLEVFDVAGRRVATLTNGFQEAGRWYEARLDGTALPSGLYHARLRVEGFSGVEYEASHALVHVR